MKTALLSLFAGIAFTAALQAQPPRTYDTAKSTNISAVSASVQTRFISQDVVNITYMTISLTPSKKAKQKKNKSESSMALIARKTD